MAVGQSVVLTGSRSDAGALAATTIRIRRTAEGEGRVLSATGSAIEIPGLRVVVSDETAFISETGAVISGVTVGQAILAAGELDAAGDLAATLVVVTDDGTTTAGAAVPGGARLAIESVFPNPATRRATVRFSVQEAATVRLTLIDALGRTVATLAEGAVAEGEHTAALDASGLAPGLYVVRLSVDGAGVAARAVRSHDDAAAGLPRLSRSRGL